MRRGAGGEGLACAFAPLVRHVTGCDLTPAMLDQAGQLERECGVTNVTWEQADAMALPYRDGEVAIVSSRFSLHHLPDPGGALREMRRVCRPGGRVVVADSAPAADKADAFNAVERLRDPSHVRARPVAELVALFAEAGLGEPRIETYRLPGDLDSLLQRSFPKPGDEARIRQIHADPLGGDVASLAARGREDPLLVPDRDRRRDGAATRSHRGAPMTASASRTAEPIIRSFGGTSPRIAPDVYLAPGAVVVGDVEIGPGSSVWFNATIRGDVAPIRIGARSNVQDNAVLHVDAGTPCVVGDDVTIGHGAIVHGTTVGDGVTIGMGAIVLSRSRVGAGAIVAAGALVPEDAEVRPGALVMGVPARERRQLSAEEQAASVENAARYVRNRARYRAEQDGTSGAEEEGHGG